MAAEKVLSPPALKYWREGAEKEALFPLEARNIGIAPRPLRDAMGDGGKFEGVLFN